MLTYIEFNVDTLEKATNILDAIRLGPRAKARIDYILSIYPELEDYPYEALGYLIALTRETVTREMLKRGKRKGHGRKTNEFYSKLKGRK